MSYLTVSAGQLSPSAPSRVQQGASFRSKPEADCSPVKEQPLDRGLRHLTSAFRPNKNSLI